MIPCDRPGYFRVSILDYGLVEENSGSIAVAISVSLDQHWNLDGQEPAWEGWSQYNMGADGKIYVVKKDGTINKGQAEALMKYAGWDGSFDSIANKTWEPTPFACNIEEDVYEGKTRFKIGFVNSFDSIPGQRSNVTPDQAKILQARFGSQFRALAGTVKRNGPAPAGAPQKPPPVSQPMAPPPPIDVDNIPFSWAVAIISTTIGVASLLV